MSTHRCVFAIACATVSLTSFAPRPAHAQNRAFELATEVLQGGPFNLPADVISKKHYEWLQSHHQKRLQADLARGDAERVNRDLYRLQADERRLKWMDWQIRRDLLLPAGPYPNRTPRGSQSATLIPHPQYPGYGYYAANPTQLYLLSSPGPSANPSATDGVATALVPSATPGTTAPPAQTPVVIVNPQAIGAAADFVVGGAKYTTPSGQSQRVLAGPSSTILYNRGGDFGTQRYSLSAGVYEFRSSDTGLALFKIEPAPPQYASLLQPAPAPTPTNDPLATARAPKAGEPGAKPQEPPG